MRYLIAALTVFVCTLGIVLFVLTRTHESVQPTPTSVIRDAAGMSSTAASQAAPVDAATISEARRQREHLLSQIVEANPRTETWNDQGTQLLQSIVHDGVTIDGVGCYMAGCVATFTFPSQTAFERIKESLPFASWTGGKQLSPPEILSDGRVIVAIALERPD